LRFALLAHDARKDGLVTWVGAHQSQMMHVRIVSTGTTGGHITEALSTLDATTVRRGPPGGDQQIGALFCEEKRNALVFSVEAPHRAIISVAGQTFFKATHRN